MMPGTRVVHEIIDKTNPDADASEQSGEPCSPDSSRGGDSLREARTAGTTTSKVGVHEKIEAH